MGTEQAFSMNDNDKTREELVEELMSLRGVNNRLKDVVRRYERVAGKKDFYSSLYDLEAERDRIESLRAQLQEKTKEAALQSEELEVQKEEIRAKLEELSSHDEAARLKEAQLKEEASCRVAEAVEVERKRLFNVLETLPVMICLLTPDHRVAFANRAFRERFGESKGRHCYEHCFGRSRPCEFCESYEVLKTEKPYRWEAIGSDGSIFDVYNYPFTDVDGTPMILEMDMDITERKRAEEALRDSEERFHQLADNSPIAMAINDKNDNITYLNKKFIEVFGYSLEDIPHLKYWWHLAYPDPAYRENAINRWEKGVEEAVRGSREIGPLDYTVTCKDGSVRYTEISGVPIGDKELVILQDVTERKRAEEALRKSEADLVKAQRIARLGNWMWDTKNDKVEGSVEFIRMFGFENREHITYGDFRARLRPEDREPVDRAVHATLSGLAPYNTDYRIVLSDGLERVIHAEGEVVRDKAGQTVQMFGTVQDITERKMAEEVLRNSEEKFRKFFDMPLIGAAVTSPEKRFVQVNDKLCEMFGYSREELLRTSWDQITHPDDLQKNLDAFERLTSGEIETYTFEKRFIGKNGSIVYVILSAGCVRDREGRVEYFASTYEDITNRKLGEIALQESKDQADMYLDLMGHDINNLNQIALGYLELADAMSKDEEARELISKPLDAIKSSSNLIDNVRKLQKSRAHGLKIEAIDLNDVLFELMRRYSMVLGREVIIELTSCPEANIMANGLIKDVFSNLIGNAVKHSDGGRPIRIDIRLERITENGSEYLKVSIEDDGPGIPDEIKDKLFTRFQRGYTKATGKGLGLYLVRTLVDDFHGRVWAEDRVQGDYTRGSRFVVVLPVAE